MSKNRGQAPSVPLVPVASGSLGTARAPNGHEYDETGAGAPHQGRRRGQASGQRPGSRPPLPDVQGAREGQAPTPDRRLHLTISIPKSASVLWGSPTLGRGRSSSTPTTPPSPKRWTSWSGGPCDPRRRKGTQRRCRAARRHRRHLDEAIFSDHLTDALGVDWERSRQSWPPSSCCHDHEAAPASQPRSPAREADPLTWPTSPPCARSCCSQRRRARSSTLGFSVHASLHERGGL